MNGELQATFAHKRIFFGSSSSRNGFYIACVPVSSIFDMLSNFNEELQSATSNALIEISPGRIPKVSFSMMRHCQMILKRPTSTLFSRNAPHLFIDGALVQSISNPYWLLEEMKLESIFMREVMRMVNGFNLISGPKITLSLFRIMTNSCHQRDDWGIFWRNGSTMHGYLC